MKDILKYFLILIITCVASYLAFLQLGKPLIGVDDANIFFVYARNLANGHGFVYQPAGERVEGFSSLLWVIICSIGYMITQKPEILFILFNIIIISYTVFNFISFIDKKFGKGNFISLEGMLAILFIYASPVFVSWTILSLMETGIWTFLLVNSVILLLDFIETKKVLKLILFSLFLFLLIPGRPEGILIGAVLILLLVAGLKNDAAKNYKYLFIPVFFYLISVISLYSFRVYYFGYFFPNTYYAKVSPNIIYSLSEGVKYFTKYLLSNNIIFVCLSGIIYHFYRYKKEYSTNKSTGNKMFYGLINIYVCTGLLIPVLWGGDVFIDFRFYQPLIPLLFIPFIYFIKELAEKYEFDKNLPKFSGIFILIFFGFYFYTGAQIKYHQKASISAQQYRIAEENRDFGNRLNEFFKNTKLPKIGTIPAGGLAYTYKGPLVDLLGLNNIEMAHTKDEHKGLKNHASFNKDVFYKQSPDFILAGFDNDTTELNNNISFNNNYELNKVVLKGLLADNTFKDTYQPALIIQGSEILFAYYRRDYLHSLENNGLLIKTR